ncbi:uncharacterized protein LOC62_03G004648 [Vanrija pseudolonga]|uniref:Uncharacterized protein n=1 Tax=Vanrija pseudolonga TaxID=143232 RepID=A0AAF1BI38_9TREE|nr:hypothetical protein LOC62_03G004648 [Vanrija pseudolonga]
MFFNVKAIAVVAALLNVAFAVPVAETNPEVASEAITFDKRAASYAIWLVRDQKFDWTFKTPFAGKAWFGYALYDDGSTCDRRYNERMDKTYGARNDAAFDPSPDRPLKFSDVKGCGTVDFWVANGGTNLVAYKAGGNGQMIGYCWPKRSESQGLCMPWNQYTPQWPCILN